MTKPFPVSFRLGKDVLVEGLASPRERVVLVVPEAHAAVNEVLRNDARLRSMLPGSYEFQIVRVSMDPLPPIKLPQVPEWLYEGVHKMMPGLVKDTGLKRHQIVRMLCAMFNGRG